MKLSQAIEQAKKRAYANGRSGYYAHPVYDVWVYCIVAFNGPRFSIEIFERGSKIRRRLYHREWNAILIAEAKEVAA